MEDMHGPVADILAGHADRGERRVADGGRSGSYANVYGGLVYASAYDASSVSGANNAARLAFCGRLLNESEIDALDDQTNEQLPATGA